MAPLDTGVVMNMRLVEPLGDRVGPVPDDFAAIGEYLRALREYRGHTLADLAEGTRIRKAYLQGIEEADRSALPARPFAIGYVRSYAQALGIDGDAAAARFKKEWPDVAEPFRDPVGVAHEKPKRSPLIIALIGVLVVGVVAWNVVQRVMTHEDHDVGVLPAADSAPVQSNTTVSIGAATPAPASQNLPAPYQTPGLDTPAPQMKSGVPVLQTASAATGPDTALPAVFTPKAPVYGAPAGPDALVVLEAKKPASLIVRGPSGAVFFARQLAEGEAYRAPPGQALSAEAVDPGAFVLYVAGENKGALTSQQTALERLAVRPAPAVRPVQLAAAPASKPVQPPAQAQAQPIIGAPLTTTVAAAPIHALTHPPVRRHPHRAVQPDAGAAEPQTHGEPPPGDVALQQPN